MARIAAVKVWGFRSLFNVLFSLATQGLTVITGRNDSGKSAFIQVIRWIALGEPTGEEFLYTVRDEVTEEILEQAEEAGAEITTEEGVIVTKTRRKGKTQYKVEYPGQEPQEFDKAEVPEEVTQALGITRHNFGDFVIDLNFGYQHNAPFILSEPASTGAKVLGKIAGTEVVDLTIKAVAKDTYQARQDKLQATKEAGERSIQLLEYQDLPALKDQLDAAEILIQQVQESVRRRDSLKKLLRDYTTINDTLAKLGEELDRLAVLPEIKRDLQDAEKAQQRYDKLLDLYSQYGKATGTVDKLTDELAKYKELDLAVGYIQLAETAENRATLLRNLGKLYHKADQEVKDAKATLDKTKELDVARAYLDAAEQHQGRATRLQILNLGYTAAAAEVNRYQEALTGTEGLEEVRVLITTAEQKQQRVSKLKDLWLQYRVKVQTEQQARQKLQDTEKRLTAAQAELAAAWEAAGGKCPLCDQPVHM